MSVYQATASAPVNIACIKWVLVIYHDLTRD